ncbi:MAG: hypothetical protein ACYSYV_00880 [Planctomycetota bacterium]|jgi:hypothetical protein
MLELGSTQNSGYGERTTHPTHRGTSDSAKRAATIKIADDDAAAATIRNPLGAQTADVQQNSQKDDALSSQGQSMKDAVNGIRERAAKFRQATKEIAGGSFAAGNPTKDPVAQSEEIRATVESSEYSVYSDTGKSLATVKEAIEAINSSDGFLIGVHQNIEEFRESTQFTAEQIPDVQQHMAELHATLELEKFSLQRIHKEALKALRGQANLEHERVFLLLKDVVPERNTAEQVIEQAAAPSGQNRFSAEL